MDLLRIGNSTLNGLNRKKYQVINQADFFLNEGLCIANASEQAIVTGSREGSFANLFFGDEEACAFRLGAVLRAIGQQGLQALLGKGCDVDHKAGAHIGIEAGVENLEGSMGRVRLAWGYHFGKAADEAGFVAQRGGGVVVGMPALPVRKNDDAGTQTAQDGGQLQTIDQRIFDVAVSQVERFAMGIIEDSGGGVGLALAVGGGAAGAGLSLGEIEDAGRPATGVHGQKSAAAGLFDVVAMGCDGKNIELLG